VTYTFSDGLTLAGTNVTNDLVTGALVDEVNALSAAGMTFTAQAGDVLFDVTGGDLTLRTNGAGDVRVEAGGDLALVADGNSTSDGNIDITAAAGSGQVNLAGLGFVANLEGGVDIEAGEGMTLQAADNLLIHSTGGTVILQSDGAHDIQINPSHDEIHTVGRNLTVDAQGSTGISLGASHAAGKVFIGATTRVTVQDVAGTGRLLAFFAGAGAEQQLIDGTLPGSGNDADTVAARVNEIINGLVNYNLFAFNLA